MEKLLIIEEVAEILGVSKVTAKIWASKRVFPVVKIGRLIRVSPQALEHWIMNKTEEKGRGSVEKNIKRQNPGRTSFDKYFDSLKSEQKH